MIESFDQPDHELDTALQALGGRLLYPETPDLASAVRERIEHRASTSRRLIPFPRRWLTVAAVLTVLVAGATIAYPASRTAVADWFDLPGVTLISGDPDEQPVLGPPLELGEPVSLDEAREAVDFQILAPDVDWLGEPDEVYLDRDPVGGAVSFVYHAGGDLPEAEETGVGLLLTQFQGYVNPGMYGKGTPPGVEVDRIEINGEEAIWLSGEPHTLGYYDRDDEYIQKRLRFAGNTLLWQDGDLTLRLESALDLDAVLEIAESMR